MWFRLFSSPALQRLVPDRLIPSLAALHARAQWLLSPRRRAAARQAMSNLVGGSSRSSEVEPLTRQHLLERSFIGIAHWRPWMLRNTRLQGHANLGAAIARGRGVLLMGTPYRCALGFSLARPGHTFTSSRAAQ